MYSIDIGNAFSVMFNGKDTECIRSVVAQPASELNVRKAPGVLKYDDLIFHAGSAAFKYDIYRMMAVTDKQSHSALLDSLILTLNLITPIRGRLEDTTELVIQVPTTFTSYQHDLVSYLNGVKSWTYDGVDHRTKLSVRQVYQEGFGSWYIAKRNGIVQDDDAFTLVIDVGGGTVIATLIENSTGESIKTNTYARTGALAFANLLCSDLDLRLDNDGNVVKVEQIFEGMENGTYRIGKTGAIFRKYVPVHTRAWWMSIWKPIINDFSAQFNRKEVTKVLVTGGGAEIAREFIIKGQKKPGIGELFAIAGDTLLDNVKGIWYASNKA